jgi:hypothetical protein
MPNKECQHHEPHPHHHGSGCGHQAIHHEQHLDYLHDGHMHHVHDGHVDEHELASGKENPGVCTSGKSRGAHDHGHVHGASCGHPKVPHAGHFDYLVDGFLHHVHDGHCDDHGPVKIA